TIKLLLKNKNRIICCSKLGRPKERTPKLSMKVVVERLQKYLPEVTVRLIDDFLTEPQDTFDNQTEKEILVLENIRFYPEEKNNDPKFTEKLASLADIYVNDAFAMCHRTESSVVGVPSILPCYGGLELREEITAISQAIKHPERPLVAIIGGAKISTKINLITKLMEKADYVILGGGLANVFFRAQRFPIGKSICEYEMVLKARQLLYLAAQKHTSIILPTDALIGDPNEKEKSGKLITIGDKIPKNLSILDIGPETQANFGAIIAKANTIIWNGPIGLFEHPSYRQGTDFIYYAITQNSQATSIVGGGDTLAAIKNKKYLEKITHISTGGGAMLEFIENGTLPGIEALKR
ncbi:MAG TPA: phosphoglycerate kinase, partial [Patescibacteria group bacterium]|nr:phosphoglycerate kinase [Patescibacteria group bacterium]